MAYNDTFRAITLFSGIAQSRFQWYQLIGACRVMHLAQWHFRSVSHSIALFQWHSSMVLVGLYILAQWHFRGVSQWQFQYDNTSKVLVGLYMQPNGNFRGIAQLHFQLNGTFRDMAQWCFRGIAQWCIQGYGSIVLLGVCVPQWHFLRYTCIS